MSRYIIKRTPINPDHAVEYIGPNGLRYIGGIHQAVKMPRKKAETIAALLNADPKWKGDDGAEWEVCPR